MHPEDRQAYVERYESRLDQFGYSPETLGWGKNGRQDVRFAVLAAEALARANCSVLDVGCGFADLYDYLRARGWAGSYTGVDIVPRLIEVAVERHPGLDLRCAELHQLAGEGTHDYVIASGVFNARLEQEDNREHIRRSLAAMHRLARAAVCVDFMSTYVDFQHPLGWHTDPGWAFGAAKELSRRAALRHDYMPFEFALFIYKEDQVSGRNVFQAFEETLR